MRGLLRYRVTRYDINTFYVFAKGGKCFEHDPRSGERCGQLVPVERDGWRSLAEIRDAGFSVTLDQGGNL